MTKLEKFLIHYGLAEKKRYHIGTIVYGFKDDDGFYGYDEVCVRPGHYFELSIGYPYIISLDATHPSPENADVFIADKLSVFESHLKWAIEFRDQLNAIENPWKEEGE